MQVPAAEIYADLENAEAEGSSLEPVAMAHSHCNGDASPPETKQLRAGAPMRGAGANGGWGISLGVSRVREKVSVCASVYEACEQAHAIIVCTEWQEFKVRAKFCDYIKSRYFLSLEF